MTTKTAAQVPIPSIVDPMIEQGIFTRAEIMAEVRRLRPDFKDPSAAVSNGFRRLVAAGKNACIKDSGEPRKSRAGVPRAPAESVVKKRIEKIDAWAARMNDEIGEGFRRLAAFQAKTAKEPKLRRIWP
jgi:hypothetical protein